MGTVAALVTTAGRISEAMAIPIEFAGISFFVWVSIISIRKNHTSNLPIPPTIVAVPLPLALNHNAAYYFQKHGYKRYGVSECI